MKPLSILKGVAGGVFVLALPVLFGTISLRWLVSDAGWQRAGFEKNGVSARTGLPPEELGRSATEISRYLLLERNDINLTVTIRGQARPLFNEREIRHMADVQSLLRGFYTLQLGAVAYALLYLAGSRLWIREGYWSALGRKLRWGGVLTLGLFGVFGVLSMLDFDKLFLRFHLLSFSNDFWMLDPTKDNLIMMFPQDFWYDSAIRLALASGAQALGATLLGTLLASGKKPVRRV